jgi:hypothetical protein
VLCAGVGGKEITTLYVILYHLVDFKSGSSKVYL